MRKHFAIVTFAPPCPLSQEYDERFESLAIKPVQFSYPRPLLLLILGNTLLLLLLLVNINITMHVYFIEM